MKPVLLTALSIAILSHCPALAEQSSTAAAAKPGAESRSRQQLSSAASGNQPAGQAKATTAGATTGSTTARTGIFEPGRTAPAPAAGKGMIPPPPDVAITPPPGKKKRALRARPEEDKPAGESKDINVGSGGPFNFTGKSQEQFSATFNWQPDDIAKDKLTFNIHFSPVGQMSGPHLNWLRVMLGNRVLATENQLKGKTDFTIDLTGAVESGVNQIVLLGQGTQGASASWSLSTVKKVKLVKASPDEIVVGQELTLTGENFDPTASKDVITLGRRDFIGNSASATQLKLKIPKDFTPGEHMVKVTVDGVSTRELKVTIRGIPELTGTNLNGVPPGAQLVIFGKNFSKKMGENQVLFGETSAEVIAASPDQLTVIVPNFYTGSQGSGDTGTISGQVGIPIKVKVGKVESINTVPINIGNSTWQDPGLKGGPDVPQVPVDWRRLLEN